MQEALTIVVVDDELPILHIFKSYLEMTGGHTVLTTDKGSEAYEAKCREKGEMRLGRLVFDLSGKPERIRIMFPDRQEWITLYVCR